MNKRSALHSCASAVVLAVSLSTIALAQTAPTRVRVTVTRVKPEMLNEWIDLQKNEVVPALKKGGVTTRTVYATGLFGNAFEYTIAQPMGKFADFDAPGGGAQARALGPQANARLNEKLRRCVETTNSFLATRQDDLSNPPATSDPAPIVGYLRIRVAPGKMQEVQALIKSDILPTYKKAKWGLTVNRRGLGANANDLSFSTPYAKYADLDTGSPILRELGPDGAAKLGAKLTPITTVIENVVRNRVADLSF
jgi:hypothetical protein